MSRFYADTNCGSSFTLPRRRRKIWHPLRLQPSFIALQFFDLDNYERVISIFLRIIKQRISYEKSICYSHQDHDFIPCFQALVVYGLLVPAKMLR